MEYNHFSVIGLPKAYVKKKHEVMTVATIGSELTARELDEILRKRSSVRVFVLPSKSCKAKTYDLCTRAEQYSEQAIIDLLRDLEFLLKQRDRVRQREAMRSGHSPKVVKRLMRKV